MDSPGVDSPGCGGSGGPDRTSGSFDFPSFPKIEAPPQHPRPRSRQTSISSDTRKRTGSFVVGGGDQFVDMDSSDVIMPLSSAVPIVGRRPNPQMSRVKETDPAPPIGGFLPANDSKTQLAPRLEEEGSGSGSGRGSGSDKNNSESLNSEDEDGNAIKIPLTSSSDSSGDAEIHMGSLEPSRGLSKAELLQYVDDPYWKRVRMTLFVSFWVVWVSMIIAAAVILGLSPKCPAIPKLSWWQKTPLYRVKPDLFFDANADGVGDLKGLAKKLDYVEGLHVKALIIDDMFQNENLKDVDEKLGTIADWDSLIKAVHKKGSFVVLDFDPTKVSKNHPWFQASRKSATEDDFYRDFFVWASEKPTEATWLNADPIWTLDSVSGRWYLRSRIDDSPILNLASKAVRSEIEDIVDYWLSKGADGFSFRGLDNLALFDGDVFGIETLPIGVSASGGVSEILAGWRAIFDLQQESTHRKRLLMLDASAAFDTLYNDVDFEAFEGLGTGVDVVLRADVVTNMQRLSTETLCDASCLKQAVDTKHEAVGKETEGDAGIKWRTEAIGGENMPRFASRFHPLMVNAHMLVLALLPGTPVLYYGDEVGMLQSESNGASTPMQWTSDSKTAGFTSSNKGPVIPLAPSAEKYNVQMQRALGAEDDHLDLLEAAMKLRQEPSVAWGRMFESSMDNQIYSFLRQAEGFPGYLVAVNVGSGPSLIDFAKPSLQVPATGVVVMTTQNIDHREFGVGSKVKLNNVYLKQGEGVVIKLEENVVHYDVVSNGH